MKTFLTTSVVVAVLALGVQAQTRSAGVHGIGPRLGVSANPDQFQFGGQIDFGDIAPRLALIPTLQVGIGDDLTTTAITADFDYRFRSEYSAWTPYVGAGVGPVFYSESRSGRDDTELGVFFQGGLMRHLSRANPGHFFMELRLGVVDTPDAAFMIGWTFSQ